jgi:RNase P subunit RPR2
MNQTRICGGCGKPMSYVGKLPQVRLKPALIVFRCFGCNAVASVPVKEMA